MRRWGLVFSCVMMCVAIVMCLLAAKEKDAGSAAFWGAMAVMWQNWLMDKD